MNSIVILLCMISPVIGSRTSLLRIGNRVHVDPTMEINHSFDTNVLQIDFHEIFDHERSMYESGQAFSMPSSYTPSPSKYFIPSAPPSDRYSDSPSAATINDENFNIRSNDDKTSNTKSSGPGMTALIVMIAGVSCASIAVFLTRKLRRKHMVDETKDDIFTFECAIR